MHRSVYLLTASVAIVGSNSLVLSPIAGAVAGSFDGSAPADVMIASAIYGLGTAVGAMTLAPQADRIGADRTLTFAIAGLVIALASSAAAPTLLLLCLAQGVAGLSAGVALPASYTLAAQTAQKGRESETIGLVLTGWTISMIAGVSLSTVLADLVHWRGVYAVMAAAAVAVGTVVSRTGDWGERQKSGQATSPMTALRVPGIYAALTVCAAYMIAFYGLYGYLGAHIQGNLNFSTTLTGLAPLAYGIGFGIAAPIDRLIDRHGAHRISLFVFLALIAAYAGLAVSAGYYPVILFLCLLWGLINHLGLNLIVGRLTALDARQRGAIMGVYSAVTYLSMFAGTALFRPVFTQYGFAACAVLSALCVLPAVADAVRLRTADLPQHGKS